MNWTSGSVQPCNPFEGNVKVRVLLIDDHSDARDSLVRRLSRDARIELVGTASNVEEARDILAHGRPEIVLVDIHRSAGDGVAVCRALKELTEAPVVAFTSFVTPDLWSEAQQAGVVDYLLKHVDTDRLGREILRLAERHGRGTRRTTG